MPGVTGMETPDTMRDMRAPCKRMTRRSCINLVGNPVTSFRNHVQDMSGLLRNVLSCADAARTHRTVFGILRSRRSGRRMTKQWVKVQ